jgi:hypothetical protein
MSYFFRDLIRVTRDGELSLSSVRADHITGNLESHSVVTNGIFSNTANIEYTLDVDQQLFSNVITSNIIHTNTISVGTTGEGIVVDGHVQSNTFHATSSLAAPKGYVEEMTGNTLVLDKYLALKNPLDSVYTIRVNHKGVVTTEDSTGNIISENLDVEELQSMQLTDASTLEYTAEILRTMGQSGIVNVRQYNTMSTYPWGRVSDSNYGACNIHNHPNFRQLAGMAEISVCINGYYIRTRHNDYSLREQKNGTMVQSIASPTLPPKVQQAMDEAGTDPMSRYLASDTLMAQYIQSFQQKKAVNTDTSDWKNHFNVTLSYIECWIQPSKTFGDQFDSERHRIDAAAIKQLFDKALLYNASGHKQRSENVSFQHTSIRNISISDDEPQFSNITWRIRSWGCGSIDEFEQQYGHRLFDEAAGPGLLHKRPDHATIERRGFKDEWGDIKESWWDDRAARFRMDDSSAYRYTASETVLDQIMSTCPGLDGLDGAPIEESYELYLGGLNLSDVNSEFRAYEKYRNKTLTYVQDILTKKYPQLTIQTVTQMPETKTPSVIYIVIDASQKVTNVHVPLDAKFYNRRFTMSGFDASGRDHATRGFNDPNLYVSLNTQNFCTPNEFVQKDGSIKQYRYSYAIPLELIITTPLESWNPLKIPSKQTAILTAEAGSQVGPQTDPPRSGYNDSQFFHLTPSQFYDGESQAPFLDPADTNLYVVYILSEKDDSGNLVPPPQLTSYNVAYSNLVMTITFTDSTYVQNLSNNYLYYIQFNLITRDPASTNDISSIKNTPVINASLDRINNIITLTFDTKDATLAQQLFDNHHVSNNPLHIRKAVRVANSGTWVFTPPTQANSSHGIPIPKSRLRYPIYEQFSEGNYAMQQQAQLRKEVEQLKTRGNVLANTITVTNTATVSSLTVTDSIRVGDAFSGEGITVNGTITANTLTSNDLINSNTITTDKIIVKNSINVGQVDGDGITVNGKITANTLASNDLVNSNTITSKNIITDTIEIINDKNAGISGTFPARTDACTSMVIDGPFQQYGGIMSGDGSRLYGFSGKQNIDLETRLRDFADSEYRLYVSTNGSDTNAGNCPDSPFRTIKKACSVATKKTTIYIEGGEYVEYNPIFVGEQVSLIGDSLRNVIVKAKNDQTDIFHVSNMDYFAGLRFVDLRSPGFCMAFPCSIADRPYIGTSFNSLDNGSLSASPDEMARVLKVQYSPQGYYSLPLPPTRRSANAEAMYRSGLTAEVKVNATKNSGIITFESTDPTFTIKSALSSGSDLVLYGLKYQVVFVNSSKSITINDKYNGDNLGTNDNSSPKKDNVMTWGTSGWTPLFSTIVPSTGNEYLAKISALATALSNYLVDQTTQFPTSNGGYIDQAAVLMNNIQFIQAETMAWIEEQSWQNIMSPEQKTKCRRDVGHIVVSMANDLTVDGSPMTARYAEFYYNAKKASVLPGPPGENQLQATQQTIVYISTLVLAIVDKATVAPKQTQIVQQFVSTHPISGLTYDTTMQKTFEVAGCGPNRTYIITCTDQSIGYDASHVFDKDDKTMYQSAGSYRNFNGTVDAEYVHIDIEFPRESMIVAYSVKNSNLKSWNVYAKATPWDVWTKIDERRISRKSDSVSIQSTIDLLITDFVGMVNGATTFSDTAVSLEGGFVDAAGLLAANRTFIQMETMAWIDEQEAQRPSWIRMTPSQKKKCQRDVGLVVDAIANDLASGGCEKSFEYATFYRDKSIPDDQVSETVESIQYIGEIAKYICVRNAILKSRNSTVVQRYKAQAFPYTLAKNTYRTNATTKYSYYRFELLQNTDNAMFKIGALQLFEFAAPNVLVDGPPIGESMVERIDVIDGGSNYLSVPNVKIESPEGIVVIKEAFATAHIDSSTKKVTHITLDQFNGDYIQSISLDDPGTGVYTKPPTVTIDNPSSGMNVATAKAFIDKTGKVTELLLVNRGAGYTVTPQVRFSPPDSGAVPIASVSRTQIHRGAGYIGKTTVKIDPPTGEGTTAQAIAIMQDEYATIECPIFKDVNTLNLDLLGRIGEVRFVDFGGGYDSNGLQIPPTISIQPPFTSRAFITASPYFQNCSNISGPFLTNGEKIPATHPLPYDVNNVYDDPPGSEKVVDAYGAGGGARIDGHCCHTYSPLRSAVFDAFTMVAQGCLGFVLTQGSYCQFVSVFGTFCAAHYIVLEGSFANASNSVSDFGMRALVSRGKSRFPYLVGKVTRPYGSSESGDYKIKQRERLQYVESTKGGYRSKVKEIKVKDGGSGYTSFPAVEIDVPPNNGDPGTKPAFARVKEGGMINGKIISVSLTDADDQPTPGVGYRFPPSVKFTEGAAIATSVLTGVSVFRCQITDFSQRPNNTRPDVSSLVRINGEYYTVVGVAEAVDSANNKIEPRGFVWDVTIGLNELKLYPPYIDDDTLVEFIIVSYLSTGSHTFEYVGSEDQRGCTYNALPEYGGVSDETKQITEENRGKVYFTSSDHLGNARIGKEFSVTQATGALTLNLDNTPFNLNNIESLKFKTGDKLSEFSQNTLLINSSGIIGDETAPSQKAVWTYLQDKIVPSTKNENIGDILRIGTDKKYRWGQIKLDTLGVTQAVVKCDVVNGLVADGNAKVFGNLHLITTEDTEIFVQSADSKTASLVLAGEEAGSLRSEVMVGNTKTTGGGIYSDGSYLYVYSRTPALGETWSARMAIGSSDWELHGGLILPSSTPGSTKRFKLTVDDSNTLTTTEI